jgi:hypothetical protein
MRKIAIDGIPFELEEQAAAAVEKLVAQAGDSANKLSAANKQLSELQGKCDALELRASDAEIQKRVEALAGEKVDRDRLASLAKDNDALVKAVIGDADVSGADITAVRTALRVIDTHVQQQPMGDVLGDAIVSAKDHQGETARDHYINSFNQGA